MGAALTLSDYIDEIYKSGFPGIRVRSERAIKRSLASYIDNIIERDFQENNIIVRKPKALMAWLKTYAAATATTTNFKMILEAALANENISPSTKAWRLAIEICCKILVSLKNCNLG